MKKRWKRIFWFALAAVVIVAAAGLAYAYPMFQMNPTSTGQIGDTDILALNNGANSLFFLPANDGYIAVDAGSNLNKIKQDLPNIGIDPQEVVSVLLTHTDADHVAALALFSNAQVYMGADELQMVDGTAKRNAISRNTLPVEVNASGIVLLNDGQEIELGGRTVICIALTGHTPGSMGYLVDGRYLFTGDAIQVKDDRIAVHPYTMDSGAARESATKLAAAMEEADLVLTAHYGWYEPGDLS